MAPISGEAQSPPSENDAGERPVRKQLKATSIDAAAVPSESCRKRSFDEARDEANAGVETGEGRRKRSRESSPQETGNTGTNTVSSPVKDTAPLDSDENEALERVDFPDFNWIAQLDSREQDLAKRWRELQAAALTLEEWDEELRQAEAWLKQREKWFGESADQLKKLEEEVLSRESKLDAREAAVEAREKALDESESGRSAEENADVDNIIPQDTTATDNTDSAMPKKKRSLEQLDEAASKKSDAVTETAQHPAENQPSGESLGEPEKKRPRDNSEERSAKAEKVCFGFTLSYLALADQTDIRVSQQVHSPTRRPLPHSLHSRLPSHPTTPRPETRLLQTLHSHHLPSLHLQVPTSLLSAHLAHRTHLFSSQAVTPCLVSRLPPAVLALVDSATGLLVWAVDSQLQVNRVASPALHLPAPPLLSANPRPSRSALKNPRMTRKKTMRVRMRRALTPSRPRRQTSVSSSRPVRIHPLFD